jgi:hypothetical protein
MPSRKRIPLIVTLAGLAAAITSAAGTAHAQDNLLHGPHPFRKDNQISAHVLVASGRADTMSGTKLAFDYNYKLTSGWIPLWLDLGLNAQHAACNPTPTSPCTPSTGDLFETYAGVRWMFATPFPVVPFLGAVGGLGFAFPNGASAANGFMIRAVGGANYFFFEWLGLGAQVGYSLGSFNYDSTFTGSHTYAVLDLGGGLIFQF